MKCTGQYQIIVDAELVQPLVEITLIDQSSGSIDDDQREDDPDGDGSVNWVRGIKGSIVFFLAYIVCGG